jgi:hypothetical protein
MGALMIPGSELALDEALVASRSNFGRRVFFYNPAKKCGKIHFCFYILADALTFAALVLKVATRNYSDHCDPNEILESTRKKANTPI